MPYAINLLDTLLYALKYFGCLDGRSYCYDVCHPHVTKPSRHLYVFKLPCDQIFVKRKEKWTECVPCCSIIFLKIIPYCTKFMSWLWEMYFNTTAAGVSNARRALIQYKDVILPVKEIPLWSMTVVRLSYLHDGISYTGKMASLYYICIYILHVSPRYLIFFDIFLITRILRTRWMTYVPYPMGIISWSSWQSSIHYSTIPLMMPSHV